MEIGVIRRWEPDGAGLDQVAHLGLTVCQVSCWEVPDDAGAQGKALLQESREAGVRLSSVWVGWPGPRVWDFVRGPATLGIVPAEHRAARVEALKRGADFAAAAGAPAIVTHCGFIPENLDDREYPPVLAAIGDVASYCEASGLGFWFETGQETPVVLLRTIERLGLSNLGINLDPANLVLYGKGNPVDALDVFGRYVRSLHVKDGLYPTHGDALGQETRVGEGKVDFVRLLSKLAALGFDGDLIIEREVMGPRHDQDVQEAIARLRGWLEALD